MYEQIALIIAQTLFLCAFIFGSQLYIAKILLKNVNARITQLDSNLAEALNNVIESKLGAAVDAPNPLVAIFADIMKNNMNKEQIQRSSDGKFKVIENLNKGT
jgi:hypothetical protein